MTVAAQLPTFQLRILLVDCRTTPALIAGVVIVCKGYLNGREHGSLAMLSEDRKPVKVKAKIHLGPSLVLVRRAV